MKKVLILACAALTACTNDIDLGPNKEQVETLSNAIGFQMAKKNMTTTKATQTLQSQGHYNFGVWGYKAHTGVGEPLIMANYLVGFGGNNAGYKMDATNQTTWGGNSYSDDGTYADGKSQWAYENLGSSDYTYDGSDEYYKQSQPEYMSNNANQYLRFWDHSSASTNFYAYAPYVNKNATSTEVSFDNNTKIMTFPNGSMKAGYDNASQFEYMYAGVTVPKTNYRKDVQLKFKRMSSRIRVKFWEDIPGYQIKIISLYDATYTDDVYATPVTAPTTTTGNSITYPLSKYAVQAGASVDFTDIATPDLTITPDVADASKSGKSLLFEAPAGTAFTYPIAGTPETSGKIGEERNAASLSATVYYGIPTFGSYKVPGFIFHVSYELTSTTGEKITVRNAKVYVPEENCQWKPNYSYTYIFKITNKSNGTTAPVTSPTNPDNDNTIDKEQIALFPIVFDGCTVEDYETEIENDYTISDPDAPVYTLSLKASSVAKGSNIIGTANFAPIAGGTITTAPSSSVTVVDSSGSTPTKVRATVDTTITTDNVTVNADADADAGTYKLIYKNGSEVVATVTFTVK